MLIEATEILNKPVISSSTEEEVGKVSDIIINPKDCKIVAFQIYQFLSKPQIVSEIDILELNKNGLIINSEDALTPPSEIIKVKEILDKKIKILGSQAITESKKVLGKIENFLIDTVTMTIVKFYIKGGILSPSIILPLEKLVKIERGKIIFENDILEGEKATQAVAI